MPLFLLERLNVFVMIRWESVIQGQIKKTPPVKVGSQGEVMAKNQWSRSCRRIRSVSSGTSEVISIVGGGKCLRKSATFSSVVGPPAPVIKSRIDQKLWLTKG